MKRNILLMSVLFVLGSSASPYAGEVTSDTKIAVADGTGQDLRTDRGRWKNLASKALYSQDKNNVLYLDGYLGAGDFVLTARLILSESGNRDAAFVLNGKNFIGFYGYGDQLYSEGRMLGDKLLAVSRESLIDPGVPFDFKVLRRDDLLSVYVDDHLIYENSFDWRWSGELGFRCVGILDFSVTGNFLDVSEYTVNAATQFGDTNPVSIQPVVMPSGKDLVDNNWHFGWPVAIEDGESVVVAFQRGPFHDASPRAKFPTRSRMVVVRSQDRGDSWSDSVDLEATAKSMPTASPGGMRAAGAASDGTMLLMGSSGLFRSTDSGVSWEHHPNAFQVVDDPDVRNLILGPNILEAEDGRLMALAAVVGQDNKVADWILCWTSTDGGLTWKWDRIELPDGFYAAEPTGCIVGDTLFILGRFHHKSGLSFNPEKGLFSMMQMAVNVDDLSVIDASVTNIHTTEAVDVLTPIFGESKARAVGGLWSQDTPELSFNPVTQRLEAIVTNRTGGGQGHENDITKQSLNIWSIEPEEFINGVSEWSFEGTLLERYIMDIAKEHDGMHPASAVIDEENGVQHIFVYLGYYHGPSGVFKITRPLNTAKVRKWWNEKNKQKEKKDMNAIRKYYSMLGVAALLAPNAGADIVDEGLILHVDAASVAESAPLWEDMSENGNSLTVNPGWSVPGLIDDAVNGHPAVVFDKSRKTGWELRGSDSLQFDPLDGSMSFFVVFKPYRYEGWQYLIRKGNHRPESPGYVLGTIPGGGIGRIVTRVKSVTDGQPAGVQSIVPSSDSGYFLYNSVLSGTEVSGYLNGQSADALNNPKKPTVFYDGLVESEESFKIGWSFDGEIAEVLVYKRKLGSEEINEVNAYLSEKYNIPTRQVNRLR